MLVHRRVTPSFNSWYPFIQTGRERHCKSLTQEHSNAQTQFPRPAFEPQLLDTETSGLTMRSLPLYHTKAELLLIIHIHHKTHSLRIWEWPQSVIILLPWAGKTKRNILIYFKHASLSLSNRGQMCTWVVVIYAWCFLFITINCIVEINQG